MEEIADAATCPECSMTGGRHKGLCGGNAARTEQLGESLPQDAPCVATKQEAELHPATRNLVERFAKALIEKLTLAEKKYGFTDGWLDTGWMDECRLLLREHLKKGDPRDVAAFCAFLWHHGESTSQRPNQPQEWTVVSYGKSFESIQVSPEDAPGTLIGVWERGEDAPRKLVAAHNATLQP